MVRGLEIFTQHFAAYDGQFVLIGGTAVQVLMEEAGLVARATKDLDIVLCFEAMQPAFVAAFWDFVARGGYQQQERGDGKRTFYRFREPRDETFPAMLELFSRKPEILTVAEGQHITPIPAGGEVESLSAILLDDDYYGFLLERMTRIGEIPVVDTLGLIALKAHAWVRLSQDRDAGKQVDSRNISKHRNDVLRLYQLVDPTVRIDAPPQVQEDLKRFLAALDPNLDLKDFGLAGVKAGEVAQVLRTVFALN